MPRWNVIEAKFPDKLNAIFMSNYSQSNNGNIVGKFNLKIKHWNFYITYITITHICYLKAVQSSDGQYIQFMDIITSTNLSLSELERCNPQPCVLRYIFSTGLDHATDVEVIEVISLESYILCSSSSEQPAETPGIRIWNFGWWTWPILQHLQCLINNKNMKYPYSNTKTILIGTFTNWLVYYIVYTFTIWLEIKIFITRWIIVPSSSHN